MRCFRRIELEEAAEMRKRQSQSWIVAVKFIMAAGIVQMRVAAISWTLVATAVGVLPSAVLQKDL